MSRCPEHDEPVGRHAPWSCPDDCRYFQAEIARVMDDVARGNFIRVSEGEDGALYRQKFVNNEPVGEPVFFRRSWEEL